MPLQQPRRASSLYEPPSSKNPCSKGHPRGFAGDVHALFLGAVREPLIEFGAMGLDSDVAGAAGYSHGLPERPGAPAVLATAVEQHDVLYRRLGLDPASLGAGPCRFAPGSAGILALRCGRFGHFRLLRLGSVCDVPRVVGIEPKHRFLPTADSLEPPVSLRMASAIKSTMRASPFFPFLVASLLVTGCSSYRPEGASPLVGAWRGVVQFSSGSFATVKDLEFMYAFHAGGTMSESSNYDSSPPVPPAYGVWRKVGAQKYEAKYAYYWTKPPSTLDEITKGNGWAPGGHGVLSQEITLSDDASTFESTIRYQVFDQAGKQTEKESVATAKATRMGF